MSWGTCYKASNNIHPGFPSLMSEGNYVTEWNAACLMNNNLKDKAGIKDNYQYRQYLIRNADSLIADNQINACAQCCGCLQNFSPRPDSKRALHPRPRSLCAVGREVGGLSLLHGGITRGGDVNEAGRVGLSFLRQILASSRPSV